MDSFPRPYKHGERLRVIKEMPSSYSVTLPVGSTHTFREYSMYGNLYLTGERYNFPQEYFERARDYTVDDLKSVVDSLRRQGLKVSEVKVTEVIKKETVI